MLACLGAARAAVSADRMEAISQLKNELHTLTPAEATRRFAEVGAVHRLSKPNPRQTKIDHFVMLYMEVRAHRDVAPRAMGHCHWRAHQYCMNTLFRHRSAAALTSVAVVTDVSS